MFVWIPAVFNEIIDVWGHVFDILQWEHTSSDDDEQQLYTFKSACASVLKYTIMIQH